MAKKKKAKKAKIPAAQGKSEELVKREYTEDEQARLAVYHKRAKRKALKFNNLRSDSTNNEDFDLAKLKRSEALGTTDCDLQNLLLNQAIMTFYGCANTDGISDDKVADNCNFAMAILNGIQPQDEIEGMLAIQMIAVHNMAMETLKRAILRGQSFDGKNINVNQSSKMLRTFIAQMEALKKYRTGGQQKMIVEHVHVNEGGQAIVGTVSQGGRENDKKPE